MRSGDEWTAEDRARHRLLLKLDAALQEPGCDALGLSHLQGLKAEVSAILRPVHERRPAPHVPVRTPVRDNPEWANR